MSVDETVEDMIAKWPDLFYSRTLALHHLFIVLGCGYEWSNGQLVADGVAPREDQIPRSAAKILAKHRTAILHVYPYCGECNLGLLRKHQYAVDPDWMAAASEIAKHCQV